MKSSQIFLKPVRVVNFADSKKVYKSKYGGRELITFPNEKTDEIYYVVGVTAIKEGVTEYERDFGHIFVQEESHKVYIVAKSIGRRFKVLEEDLIFVEVDDSNA